MINWDDIPEHINVNRWQHHFRQAAFCNVLKKDGDVMEVDGDMYERLRHGWVKLSQDGSILREMTAEQNKLLDELYKQREEEV